MTPRSSKPDLCPRCGTRPADVQELDRTTDPPAELRLCKQCFAEEMETRLQAFLRKSGADLETAYRDQGLSLPPGLSGEQFVRAMFAQMQEHAFGEEGRKRWERWRPQIEALKAEVEAGLPGGVKDPEFPARLQARLASWFEGQATGEE
jgi:hypothetical protein